MTKGNLLSGEYALPWRYFLDITQVPRPSKHEEKIQQWLRSTAASNGWECRNDAIGNIVIAIPGTGNLAELPPLILQGHMDMVCEKNANVDHDFFNDPIETHIEGDWLTSGKTTLGADNGVAMALGLAVASETMPNRLPIELLITIDEETGLTGALELDPELVSGQHVLNLDSEDERVFIIGCAGGLDLTTTFPVIPALPNGQPVTVSVSGLKGGHSGICIHENRENAILLLGEILNALKETGVLLGIAAINGGNKRNAIPREASATVLADDITTVSQVAERVANAFRDNEPLISVSVCADHGTYHSNVPLGIVDFLKDFPNGVIAMEPDIPDLVRTSCSLGVVTTDGDHVCFIANTRSSAIAEKNEVGERIKSIAATCGGQCERSGAYPGWEPHSGSKLVARAAEIYNTTFGHAPVIQGIHAGLEAGIIGDILGTRELLAFGPLIENAHSPEERLSISSFEASYRFLKKVVASPITAS